MEPFSEPFVAAAKRLANGLGRLKPAIDWPLLAPPIRFRPRKKMRELSQRWFFAGRPAIAWYGKALGGVL